MLNELAERVRSLEALVASSRARKEFSQLDKDCAMEIVRHIYNDLLSTSSFSEEEEPEIEVSLYGEVEDEQIEVELEHFIEKTNRSEEEEPEIEVSLYGEVEDEQIEVELEHFIEKTNHSEEEVPDQEEACSLDSITEIDPQNETDNTPLAPEDTIEAEDEILLDEELELELEPEQYVLQKEDEYFPELEEQVVYISNDDDFDASYFEMNLSDEEFNIIKEELCEGDEVECNALVRKLNNFNDFDEAILYIQENYSEYNGQALEILAEKLTDKLV